MNNGCNFKSNHSLDFTGKNSSEIKVKSILSTQADIIFPFFELNKHSLF